MKLAGKARHLEVQLLADQYGYLNISLFGRDLFKEDIKRLSKKLLSLLPSKIPLLEWKKASCQIRSISWLRSCWYCWILYSHDDDKFYFLNWNPRLQVEHPTTEMATGCQFTCCSIATMGKFQCTESEILGMSYGVDPKRSFLKLTLDLKMLDSLKTQRRPPKRSLYCL